MFNFKGYQSKRPQDKMPWTKHSFQRMPKIIIINSCIKTTFLFWLYICCSLSVPYQRFKYLNKPTPRENLRGCFDQGILTWVHFDLQSNQVLLQILHLIIKMYVMLNHIISIMDELFLFPFQALIGNFFNKKYCFSSSRTQ